MFSYPPLLSTSKASVSIRRDASRTAPMTDSISGNVDIADNKLTEVIFKNLLDVTEVPRRRYFSPLFLSNPHPRP